MFAPSANFLSRCLVTALLDRYHVEQPPVPIRKFIASPPPDLTADLTLVEVPGVPFRNAVWVRLYDGQGRVFVDANVPEPQRRYAMAKALFTGLCASKGGRAVGLTESTKEMMNDHAAYFGRLLLMPLSLFPKAWETMSATELASMFEVPLEVAEARLRELKNRYSTAPVCE